MATVMENLFKTIVNVDEELDFQPFDYPGVEGGTSRFGEIALIRTAGHAGNFHAVGLWRVEPGVSPLYDIPGGDESAFVVEGSATIEFLDKDHSVIETRELRQGDCYSFEHGTLMRWTIHESFCKFVIVVDNKPAE